jgi:acetone carboxylase, beta subunit
VAGYTEGVSYREVLVPAWAAGFSAFGCACADFDYRYDQTVDLPLLPAFGEAERAAIGTMITGAWLALQDRVAAEFSKSEIARESIRFTHAVRMQYYGQLNDIEFISPHRALEGAREVDDLIAAFEDAYAKMYASSARSPEFGYLVTHVIVHGTVDVEKPALPEMLEQEGKPPLKARRRVHWGRASEEEFVETDIFQLEEIHSGNSIEGPAIVEHSATTFAIPPGRTATLDAHHIFHLLNAQEV